MEKEKKFKFKTHYLYILIDFIICFGVSWFWLMSCNMSKDQFGVGLLYCLGVSLVLVIFCLITRIYKILTTNYNVVDAAKTSACVIATALVSLIAVLFLRNKSWFPYTSIWSWALCSCTIAFLVPGCRMFWRVFKMIIKKADKDIVRIPTLVIGAGSSAKIVVDDSRTNKQSKEQVVVIVDDDVNKIGGSFANIPVKGPISEISTIIDFYHVEEVVIAISNLTNERLHEILNYLEPCNVRIKRMPILSEMSGPNDTRIIDVDVNEMLSRNPIQLDNSEIKNMLSGKTVMVTGAGGSIGSELVRQIFAVHPKTLLLFDIYENSTYDIQQELVRKINNEHIDDIEIVALIGSTYNEVRMEQIISKYRPDYIYHAAAYKHVPLMEDSPMEAIRTNVIGTYNVARLADKYKVKKMLLVSTDKAVRPTNVMGATKRFAETIIQYFAEKSTNTAYCAVRFGNVLGSNGSVIPLFKKQIAEGGPVTVTHKEINRFFMTIPEAVGLILQSSLYASGGEIFILDMGKPVKIIDLAEKMIRQAGLVPYTDIEIKITGLRPGEKIYEELLLDVTKNKKTANKKIFIEENVKSYPIENEIVEITKVFNMENNEDIKDLLSSIITSYQRNK